MFLAVLVLISLALVAYELHSLKDKLAVVRKNCRDMECRLKEVEAELKNLMEKNNIRYNTNYSQQTLSIENKPTSDKESWVVVECSKVDNEKAIPRKKRSAKKLKNNLY